MLRTLLMSLYQSLVLSCQTSFTEELHQTANDRPVGGSGDRVQAAHSGGSVRAARSLRSILPLQDAHRGCRLEVLQPEGLLLQELDNLRNFLDTGPHPQTRFEEYKNKKNVQ